MTTKNEGGTSEEDMIDKKIIDDSKEDDESADDSEDESDEESEKEESDDDSDEESEEEDESEGSSKKKELDLDAELERERELGKPDPVKAIDAFKKRNEKRQEHSSEDKPLTKKDLDAFEAKIRKDAERERAFDYAKEMAGSEKEAELIVAKWGNRTFPKTLTLKEQIQEAYAITHSKKIIGERDEAIRALRGKTGIKTNSASTHHDAPSGPGGEPKLPKDEAQIMRQSGFVWNQKERRHEKKLPNGTILVRDPKTKQVRPVRRS